MSSLAGRTITNNLKQARRAVARGEAAWLVQGPNGVASLRTMVARETREAGEAAERREAARKPARRPFGEGILASRPNYRLNCTLEDQAWWEEESRREEDRMIDRLYEQFKAQERIDAGLNC